MKYLYKTLSFAAALCLSQSALAIDQCNNTAECRTLFGPAATDCQDSKSDQSVCLCGDVACSTNAQTPFKTHDLPGRVEVEDYDNGGADLAFSDANPENMGGAYRNDAVDLQVTSDSGGGHNLGWTQDGEWLEYTLRRVQSGVYAIRLRVAANDNVGGKSIQLALDGQNLGTARFTGSGGWQNWKTVTLNDVSIAGGSNKVLRVNIGGGRFNLNWIEFEDTGATPTQTPSPTATPTPTNGRRIAVTADGNANDRDDICATPVSLGLIARAGLGEQLVHYSYNDHVWREHHNDNMQRQHRISYEGTVSRTNGAFPNVRAFDAYDNTQAAVSHLTGEINRSSRQSPLFVVMAGRAEIIGRAIRAANKSALAHVTVISHSTRNNTHGEEFHNGIPWREVQNSGVTIAQIRNQNTDTKKAYSEYRSLNNSGDELKQWIWDRCNVMDVTTFDPSDAGMTYYLLNDNDERANPRKLLAGLDASTTTPPNNSAEFEETNGLVVMEMESTASNLNKWDRRSSVSGYTGTSYLEFTGNTTSNGPADSPLRFTFKVNTPGLYYLHAHVARETVNGRGDVANDAYVRLEGDFSASNRAGNNHGDDAPLSALKSDTKFFGGDDKRFVWTNGARLDLGGTRNKRVAVYNLRAGQTYTLVVSGRSQKFKMDRIVLRHQSVTTQNAFRLSNQETR